MSQPSFYIKSMGQYIETISQFVPKNDANFGIADVNDLKGGYIQVDTREQMMLYLEKYSNRLKVGMLCFVIDELQIYQFLSGTWKTWQPKSGASLSLMSVSDMDELIGSSLEIEGQVVFVRDLNALRWYDGNVWQSFSKIYIQSTPPDDINGIWIDVSNDKSINQPETIVTQLLKMINVLARKVHSLEYRNQQIQSGTFENNMFDLYNNIIGIDPESEINGIIDEEDADGTNEQQEYDEATLLNNTLLADSSEPVKYKDLLPNVKHIQIKYGTYSDMIKYKDNFLPAELLYSYNTRELWLKDPKTYQLIKIGATGGGGGDIPEPEEDIMNGIIQSGDYIASISFVDMVNNSKHYKFTVQNGELDLEYEEGLTTPISSTQEKSFVQDDVQYYSTPYIPVSTKDWQNLNSLIWVHSVYTAGNKYQKDDQGQTTEGYNTYNPCNFDFIELCNLNFHPVNLNGFYLHYSEGSFNSNRQWISLPLRGTIRPQSTYLIKCARSGEDKFARIKVGKPDIYFSKDLTLNSDIFEDSVNNYSIWDEDGMLQINKSCSFFISGPCYVTENSDQMNDSQYTLAQLKERPYTCQNPWIQTTAKIGVVYGYCDIVGFGTGMPSILTKPVANLNKNSFDNTKQAYKSVMASDGWASSKLWTYINLVTPNGALKIEDYTPKASFKQKNIFYNKHLLEDGKPLILNCSLGYNAHTTRCFSWVSKGYRDEYLQYKKLGDTEWITVESFKEGDNRASRGRNWDSPIYNRIRSFTSDGTYFTSHKCIIDLYDWNSDGPDSDEIYVYRVGYKYNWTDERTFTLRNRQSVISNGFSYVQFTDQQGFNQEEYEEWRLVAEHIMDYYSGNKVEYELSPLRQDSVRLSSVPKNPKATDNRYIIVGSYYQLTESEGNYSYAACEEPASGEYTNYSSVPTATNESAEYIYVGTSYELVTEKKIEFSINTGDATQNGNRINEWVDYFVAGTSVFNKLEQQYTVGNNDLCPIIPQELGTGDDTTKVNPKNVEFFFTFEHPFQIPVSVNGTYVPSTYSYIYGDTLFMSMNSELTDSKNDACLAIYGEQSYDLQQRLKTWAENELASTTVYMTNNNIGIPSDNVKVPRWKIAFCHESPFTLVIQSVLSDYKSRKIQDNTYTAPDRGTVTSHFNSPGGYWFSKFLEDNAFNMCMCGHKHTYTTSRYLHDNPDDRMQPYVYDPAGSAATFINEDNRLFMIVTDDTTKNYVKYTMCQASGYKLTSNKELPGRNIGWLEQYYPGNAVAGDTSSVTVNTGQRYPHYIIWTVGRGVETENPTVNKAEPRERILGKTWKIQSGLTGQTGNNKMYNYNDRIFYAKDIQRLGGNGTGNSGLNNIIVEKLPKTIEEDGNSVYSVINAELTGNDGDEVTLLNNN